jgi:hypothetical protein
MSESDGIPVRGASDLELAAAQLRDRPLPDVVAIADRVLEHALAAPRMSELVRAQPPHERLRVSTVALVALLRDRIDEGLEHAAVRRAVCEVSRDARLEQLTVELIVRYGHDIRELAERARVLAREVLGETLGIPAEGGPVIVVQHVHVGDVTVADPHLVDPADEEG